MDRTLSRWLPVLAVVAVLGLAAAAAATSSPELTKLPVPALQTAPTPSVETSEPTDAASGAGQAGDAAASFVVPAWLTYAAGVLCLLVVLGAIGTLVWWLLRSAEPRGKGRRFVEQTPATPMTADGGADVMAAVDAGLVELSDTDTDPRRAVIACWVRLERAAAAAGTPREVGDSSTDLVTRLLGGHQISRPTLESLAFVYREARYATHPVGEQTRRLATEALRELRAELSLQRGGAGRGA